MTINSAPEDYLRRWGHVFAHFGAPEQDSGNVSYGVKVGEQRFFVKAAGDPEDDKPFLSHADRVALLRNAVRLSQSCPHTALPKLYNVIESPAGPMLVYEWLEGELLRGKAGYRDDPKSAYLRFRGLPAAMILDCLDIVYDLHRELTGRGWLAVDFYDGCMIYDFASGKLGIVDLDHYRQGPLVNEMGRMFGSTRFMAPEEFELGATIDERTTVFVMGRTAAVFLADGSVAPEVFRGSQSLHAVVAKACQPDPARRFATLQEFHAAWSDARRGLHS